MLIHRLAELFDTVADQLAHFSRGQVLQQYNFTLPPLELMNALQCDLSVHI